MENETTQGTYKMGHAETYATVDMTTAKPALIAALVKAKLDMEKEVIKYEGLNKEQGFAFITKAQMWKLSREILSANGIVVLSSYTRENEGEYTSKGSMPIRCTQIIGKHTVTDGDSSFVITTLGMAYDNWDKSERKAQTDSRKVMLEQLLDVSASDEEVDGSSANEPPPPLPLNKINPKAPKKAVAETEQVTEEQAPVEQAAPAEKPKMSKITPRQKISGAKKQAETSPEPTEQPQKPQAPVVEETVAEDASQPVAEPQISARVRAITPIKIGKPAAPKPVEIVEVYEDDYEETDNAAATADSEVVEVYHDINIGIDPESEEFL